jgi:putative iron-regulated protein
VNVFHWLPRAALCAGIPLALMGCLSTGDSSNKSKSGNDVSKLLSNYANEVVLADYSALLDAATALHAAAQDLAAAAEGDGIAGTDVDAAREAWVATREPWEQSEALLFGPVENEGIDPAIDTWPLDADQLDTAIANVADFDADTASENVRGFHAIEYLLWGQNDSAAAIAATLQGDTNQVEYLVKIGADLADKANDLVDAWDPGQDDFVSEFADAGQGSESYSSQSAAMQEIVNGIIGIADEVANGKLYTPYSEGDVNLVESQFSRNSRTDFTNNITSIRNAYLGAYGADETAEDSLSALVTDEDADLDGELKAHIEASIDALAAIEPSFEEAVASEDNSIQEAIDTINQLRDDLQSLLLPLVQELDYKH